MTERYFSHSSNLAYLEITVLVVLYSFFVSHVKNHSLIVPQIGN